MGNEFKGRAEHSAEHFGDTRDYWWNRDFLQLMAKRWKLGTVRNVLDVGCGVGHWGMLLASVMPETRGWAKARSLTAPAKDCRGSVRP